ncbi:MAG: hypothetical protein RMJ37_07490 [Spirochaetia bacterium]|nr:hypothetical protein [Spirochaetota bacterium]MDW8113156.1 hypothetical protein [Spirochaetia bacterium]
MRKVVLVIVLVFFFISCGIDIPEIEVKLRPPMGLKASFTTNDTVMLEFWGFNEEDYFSGYVVFVSAYYSDIADTTKPLSEKNKIPDNQTGTLPTFSVLPTTSPQKYRFELPLTTKDEKNNLVFFRGVEYYIAVASYSSSKKIYSPLSNITNVVLTN